MEAEITLEYDDVEIAEAVVEAISPDNLNSSPSLSVETISEGKRVVTHIRCKRKISTFIATIDDLLFCISTAEKTLRMTRKLR